LRKAPLEELQKLASNNAGSFPVQMALGTALRKAGSIDDAVEAFERAAALVPLATGPDSPHAQLAEIALGKKDKARAIKELTALVDVDVDNVEAARQLASLLKEQGVKDPERIRPVYERILALDPFDAEAQAIVGRLALDANQPEVAARAFRAVIALKPVDPATAHTDLAESYLKAGRRDDAKKETLAALELAPTFERAQNLLLRLAEARP
jgi:tetratricopeptide (TPR) repeat protein